MQTTQLLDVEMLGEALVQIVSDVLAAMLRSETIPMRLSLADNPLRAVVCVAGEWNGAVLVECDGETAKNFCSGLMRIQRPETVDLDVVDSLGEIANMIGGNLKSLLPSGCFLSVPTVMDASGSEFRIVGAQTKVTHSFDGPEGPFIVTLFAIDQDTK